MSRRFKIEITESEAEMKKRLQTAREGSQKEKLQMLWWVKSGQVSQQEIGRRLGRDSESDYPVVAEIPTGRNSGAITGEQGTRSEAGDE